MDRQKLRTSDSMEAEIDRLTTELALRTQHWRESLRQLSQAEMTIESLRDRSLARPPAPLPPSSNN
ncbi:MAG: hypothetical protein ACI8TP_003734 [Acidimicrobiales bacterium]|jgi:hypothetical protein